MPPGRVNKSFNGVLSFCSKEIGVWPTSVFIENGASCFLGAVAVLKMFGEIRVFILNVEWFHNL